MRISSAEAHGVAVAVRGAGQGRAARRDQRGGQQLHSPGVRRGGKSGVAGGDQTQTAGMLVLQRPPEVRQMSTMLGEADLKHEPGEAHWAVKHGSTTTSTRFRPMLVILSSFHVLHNYISST